MMPFVVRTADERLRERERGIYTSNQLAARLPRNLREFALREQRFT